MSPSCDGDAKELPMLNRQRDTSVQYRERTVRTQVNRDLKGYELSCNAPAVSIGLSAFFELGQVECGRYPLPVL